MLNCQTKKTASLLIGLPAGKETAVGAVDMNRQLHKAQQGLCKLIAAVCNRIEKSDTQSGVLDTADRYMVTTKNLRDGNRLVAKQLSTVTGETLEVTCRSHSKKDHTGKSDTFWTTESWKYSTKDGLSVSWARETDTVTINCPGAEIEKHALSVLNYKSLTIGEDLYLAPQLTGTHTPFGWEIEICSRGNTVRFDMPCSRDDRFNFDPAKISVARRVQRSYKPHVEAFKPLNFNRLSVSASI